jgi:hypothetical protein
MNIHQVTCDNIANDTMIYMDYKLGSYRLNLLFFIRHYVYCAATWVYYSELSHMPKVFVKNQPHNAPFQNLALGRDHFYLLPLGCGTAFRWICAPRQISPFLRRL